MLAFLYITNRVDVAKAAHTAGVTYLFIDMEVNGKEERQKGMNSVKSHHTFQDLADVRSGVPDAKILVRINPMYEGTAQEIETAIQHGADAIMLPMWKKKEEVDRFVQMVHGRCETFLLLETKEAAECLDEVLQQNQADVMYIGLNDLHLSYHKKFMFELLADGTVETICAKLKKAGVRYGFGGVGRIGEGKLPAELILAEHVRLGSHMVILSRSFFDASQMAPLTDVEPIFQDGIACIRQYEEQYAQAGQLTLEEHHRKLCETVKNIVTQ